MRKLYCFVDETGQDTRGNLFLVVVVIKDKTDLKGTEDKLLEIEKNSGKKIKKWTKTSLDVKISYLQSITNFAFLKKAIYYSVYTKSTEFKALTLITIAKTLNNFKKEDCKAIIAIDGLAKEERNFVKKELKKLKIKYDKVVGMKDESSPFIRLADALAGFLRDNYESQKYTKDLYRKLVEKKFVTNI